MSDINEKHLNTLFGYEEEWRGSPHTATFAYDLTDIEGRSAFEYAKAGFGLRLAVDDLLQEMRTCWKHGGSPCTVNTGESENNSMQYATEHWRDRLYDLMEYHGVPLEMP